MIETFTLITLCVLYLVFFRPGKTPVLDSPMVIERPGQYRIAIAPQLNRAQPFVEAVAKRLARQDALRLADQQYAFAVFDKQVVAGRAGYYRLLVGAREGRPDLQVSAAVAQERGVTGHGAGESELLGLVRDVAAEFGLRVEARE